ncbi:manganese efflux pump MntP family protein [Natranaerobius thermophilus]|nr:manganese efflux pump [Natranaerobius thermophilus]
MLVISSNLDDLGVGFSIGIQKRIPVPIILVIASISGLTMALGIGMGVQLLNFIPRGINDLIGALVFLGLGIYFVVNGLRNQENDENRPIKFTLSMAIILGLTLGINSLALGVSAGITGYPLLPTSIAAFLVSFIFLFLGSVFGGALQPILKKSDIISGILLVFLAFAILLTPL